MRIGFDLDDTLVELYPQYLMFHNNKHNTNYTKKDLKSFKLRELFGGTEEDDKKRWEEFFQSEYLNLIKPVTGSVEAVNKLRQNHKLAVITARPIFGVRNAISVIEKYFSGCFMGIYFGRSTVWQEEDRPTKLDICNQVGIEKMVEDSIEFAGECASPSREVYLISQPWNVGITPEHVTRIYTLKDVIEKLR